MSTGHKTRQWVRAANAGQHSRPSHPRLNPSDTTINFQGCPAHRAGQRGSHKPATAVVGSYSLVPALPTHERPSRRDAGHRRDRASPHPTPVSTLHALGACVSTTAWAAASPARGPPTRGGGRGQQQVPAAAPSPGACLCRTSRPCVLVPRPPQDRPPQYTSQVPLRPRGSRARVSPAYRRPPPIDLSTLADGPDPTALGREVRRVDNKYSSAA